ncbi:MAG: M20 family metallopeptidase [archaeon]
MNEVRRQDPADQEVGELKKLVTSVIEQNKERFFEISRFMYDNPEIGYSEVKASQLLSTELEKHGFRVVRGVAGLPTAFTATFDGQQKGPTIAILAEYDALPGVGHGCGHNIIGTSAIAAAVGLSKLMPKLPGKLVVVGTPNEEGGAEGGKIREVDAGVFEDIDAAIMIHPGRSARSDGLVHPKVTDETKSLALGGVEIRFKGKATHAAATPELGINALDAIILTFVGLNTLRQHIRSDSRIHGIITEGGKAPNIVPEEAAAYFYVRAGETSYMWELMEKLKGCAEGAAKATGATLQFKQSPHHMEVVKRNYTLSGLLEKNLRSLGERVEEMEEKPRGSGSTDLGNVSVVVPATSCTIAIGPRTMLGHSKEMAEATVSQEGKHGLLLAAKTMALSCIDLMTQPELMQTAKDEFQGIGKQ